MVDGTATVSWKSVLTDVLDAPIPKLTMCNDVDTAQDLIDTRSLFGYAQVRFET